MSALDPEDDSLAYDEGDSLGVQLPASNFYSILDAYPDSTFDIIGHSLGGLLALYWAGMAERYRPWYPERVHSIVTLDSPVGGMPDLRYLLPLADVPFDVETLTEELRPGSYVVAAAARAPSAIDVVTLGNTNQLVVPQNVLTLADAWRPLDRALRWDAGGPLTGDDLLPFKERLSYYHALIASEETALEWVRAAVLTDGPRWAARAESPVFPALAVPAPPVEPTEDAALPARLGAAVESATGSPLSVSRERMLLASDDRYRIVYERRFDWFVIELLGLRFEEARPYAEQRFVRLLGDGSGLACSLSVSVVDSTGAGSSLDLCEHGSSGGGILVGESTHGSALANSPGRRVFEGEDGRLYVFFYDGQNVVVSTMSDGETFGPPLQVSHVPVASSGFSVAMADGFFLVAYGNVRATRVFVTRVELSADDLGVREPSTVAESTVDGSFQAPFVALGPHGFPWIVFRADRGMEFPVFVARARSADGVLWDDPAEVSSPEQLEDSTAGTSAAIYWPGSEPVVVQGGATALHASIHTSDGWEPSVVDDEYTGVHDFSGVVIEGTLHLAYMVAGELRLISYHQTAGWFQPVRLGQAATRSVTISNVNGVPTVFGYDGQAIIWYRTLAMDEPAIIASLQPDIIQYAWTASPAEASGIIAVWVDGVEGQELPRNIYLKRLDPGED